jgi:ectoine hydroxylase-related dioxygenase (phytanoyl-CoA dioxygenase family)
MEDIKIIDDFLPASYQTAILDLLDDEQFEWHYVSDVTDQTYKNTDQYTSHDGLAHVFLGPKQQSTHFDFIRPLLYNVEQSIGIEIPQQNIWRARAGMLPAAHRDDPDYNNPHVDHIIPHWTGLYYVNDTDGPTYIFDQKVVDVPFTKRNDAGILDYINNTTLTIAKVVEPKKGRFVIFNGYRFHSSSRPQHSDKRIVITFNWKK